ncbi:MAG TPA: hypothetical protein VGF59_35955, partial [Bryobacteraceae bacterium]
LVKCAVITGQVLDQHGQPVHATVFAMMKSAADGVARPFPGYAPGTYSQADGSGRYRLFNLAPGEYSVAVSYGASTRAVGSSGSAAVTPGVGSGAQFYPTNARPRFFTVAGGEDYSNIDFTLAAPALYTVTGKVEAPAPIGEFLKSNRFWVALSAPDQPALAVAVAQTEPDGSFKLEGVQPGSYQVYASGPSNARSGLGGVLTGESYFGAAPVAVGPENVEGVAIAVQKGLSAAFALRSKAQHPESFCAPTAKLALASLEDRAVQLDRSADISLAKEATLDQLAPARYQVSVTGLGPTCYQAGPVVADLSKGAAGPIEVPVAAAGAIHGRLTGARAPADFVVALIPAGESVVHIALPDANARFTFDSLRPGRYYIAAQPVVAPRVRSAPDLKRMIEIEIPGGSPTDLELPVPQ